jgi:hypothetical protein
VSQRKGAQGVVDLPSGDVEESPSAVHVGLAGTHLVVAVSHAKPVAQSVSPAHLPTHAVVPQAYEPHVLVAPSLQVPTPSQYAASVAVPSAQLAGLHSFAGPFAKPTHLVRSFPPSHASALHTSVPPASHAARVPFGAPETGVHLPGAPATSQASHCPAQSESQHTASTQKPVAQSLEVEHDWPASFTHAPGVEVVVSAHTALVGQVALPQQTDLPPPAEVQWPLLHCVSSVQIVPRSPVVTHTPALQA